MTACELCADEMMDDICAAVAPPSEPLPMCCTRKVGHDGDHVACGLRHNLASWANDRDEKGEPPGA